MTVDQAVRRAAAYAGLRVVSSDGRTWTLASATSADAAAADDYRPAEIVVTAQKRVESVQDVPIAVTALSVEDLHAQKNEGAPVTIRAEPNQTFRQTNTPDTNLNYRGNAHHTTPPD